MATLPKAFWPVTISSGVNDKIDFLLGATPYTGTVVAGTYYDPKELVFAVRTALQAAVANGFYYSLDPSPPGTVRTLLGGTSAFTLKWGTGSAACKALALILGWPQTDTAAATVQISPNQHQNGWYGDRSIGFDGKAWFKRASAQGVALGGTVKSLVFGEQELRSIAFTNLPATKTKIGSETAGTLNEAIERLWRYGYGRFRWWPDASVDGTYVDYVLDSEALKEFNPTRLQSKELYSLRWDFRRYV